MRPVIQPKRRRMPPKTLTTAHPSAANGQVAAVRRRGRAALAAQSGLFLLVAFGLLHGLAFVADRTAPGGTTLFLQNDQRHVDQVLQAPEPLEALAIGNSHNAAFNLRVLGHPGHAFTRADSDYFETDFLLRELIMPRQPTIQTVYIPVSYFSFHWDSAAAAETRVRRWHMYAVLPTWRFRPGDFGNFAAGKSQRLFPIQSVVRADHWQAVFAAWLGAGPEPVPVEIAEDDCRFLAPDGLTAQVQARAERTTRLLAEMAASHPTVAADTYQALANSLVYLQARGVRVVLVTPPYYETYNEFYSANAPEMLAVMRANVRSLQAAYGIAYYDFSADTDFTFDHQLFADADHLNGCGAQQFSEKLKQALAGNAQ